MTAPVIAVELAHGDARPADAALVAAARAAGAQWIVASADDSGAALLRTVRAAAAERLGLIVRLDSTRAIEGLGAACVPLGDLSVAALRDRLLVVVARELTGKRLRGEARWAPSALAMGDDARGFRGWFRRTFPHVERGRAECDDAVVRPSMFGPATLRDRLVPEVRRRGGRVWVEGLAAGDVAAFADTGVHGVIVTA